jgi:hypothetical protein
VDNLVNVGGDDWDASYAGGGPADSVAQIVRSIEQDDAFSLVANGVTLGLDMLGVLESPIKALAGSVVSWLMEHIGFLDWFLDVTAGDPQVVEDAVETWRQAARDLDQLAADHADSLSDVPTYVAGGSGSFNAFFETVLPRAEDIKARGLACAGQASALTVDAAIVSTLRGTIRDLIAEFVLWLIKTMAKYFALAPYTGGASLAWAAYESYLEASKVAHELIERLAQVSRRLAVVSRELDGIRQALEILAKNVLTSGAKGAYLSTQDPELSKADQAVARRDPPPAPPPSTPRWRVQGTLDDG